MKYITVLMSDEIKLLQESKIDTYNKILTLLENITKHNKETIFILDEFRKNNLNKSYNENNN